MVDHLRGGRKSAHPGQRNSFVDTFVVFQVTKRPLVAAVQMVGATFSLYSGERQQLSVFSPIPFSHPNTTPGELTCGSGQQPYPPAVFLQQVFLSSHVPPSGQTSAALRLRRARSRSDVCRA